MTDVAESLASMPNRYIPDSGTRARGRFRIHVGRLVRDVVLNGECTIERASGIPDVEISTDPRTWREMDAGRLSGIEAFAQRRLTIRGSIDRSLVFEPAFSRPEKGGMRYTMERVRSRRTTIDCLIAGPESAPPLLLIHGLGATKASWLTVVPALARNFRVIAFDLPGYGESTKPMGSYDAPWFAQHVVGLLDSLEIDKSFVAGNSMGGRVAMETAMRHGDRVEAIACLCPAAAFTHRPALGVVKVLRPEFGMLLGRLPRKQLIDGLRQLFCDPACIEEDWYEAAIDDFRTVWKSPRARMAFFKSLRNIYLDEPIGDEGFWTRLEKMETPALYVYGKRDTLITHHFSKKVTRALPKAKVVVWDDCGHVPQIEHPERTSSLLESFFGATRSRSSVGS